MTGNFATWFLSSDMLANRTGDWYIGIAVLKDEADLETVATNMTCE
jgi:hypothetical protein